MIFSLVEIKFDLTLIFIIFSAYSIMIITWHHFCYAVCLVETYIKCVLRTVMNLGHVMVFSKCGTYHWNKTCFYISFAKSRGN